MYAGSLILLSFTYPTYLLLTVLGTLFLAAISSTGIDVILPTVVGVFLITTASAPSPIGFFAYYLRVPKAPFLEGDLNAPLVSLEYVYATLFPTLLTPAPTPTPDTSVRKSIALPLE